MMNDTILDEVRYERQLLEEAGGGGLPEVNIPLLRKAVEWVLAEDERPVGEREWHQRWWRSARIDKSGQQCGTVFCVAGFICEQDPDFEWAEDKLSPSPWAGSFSLRKMSQQGTLGKHAGEVARYRLGVTHWEGENLFFESNTAADVLQIAREICTVRGEVLGL